MKCKYRNTDDDNYIDDHFEDNIAKTSENDGKGFKDDDEKLKDEVI